MQTFTIISAIIVLAIALLLFALTKYRTRAFNKLSYAELVTMLRRSRATYNSFNYEQRNSRYGKLLAKSILAIEYRINELNNN